MNKFDLEIKYYKIFDDYHVFYKFLYIKDDLRGTGTLFMNNIWSLSSQNCPQLTYSTIFLGGTNKLSDNDYSHPHTILDSNQLVSLKNSLESAWLELNGCPMPETRFTELVESNTWSKLYKIIDKVKKSG